MGEHTEIPVRVNAWVDEGIAPLVLALNEIDGVWTLSSCERGILGRGYVDFTYGQDWKELAVLVDEMAGLLVAHPPPHGYGYTLHLEWLGGITPRAQVLVDPERATLLADAITKIAPELNRRMMQSVGDRARKVPHRSTTCSARH